MRVTVDMQLCRNLGECCFVAPEVFELGDDDTLVYEAEPDEALRTRVVQAAAVCPTLAIAVED